MIEEPVVNLSLNRTRPTSGEVRRQGFQHEVAIRDRIERIGHRPVEAERVSGGGAVDRERGAGQGRRAERRFVEALARIGKAATVARRHLDIGQKMVPERHRLRGLQMGEARHHGGGMFQRALRQRLLERGQRRIHLVDGVADIEPEIGRHLVVARTRGMQPSGGGPDQFAQPALDIHVNVLERALEIERSALDL
jgi:hypothetical protein